uniref:ADF-H domain-containing protein n=1 Tax=Aplanochytrium stocchinoi TaxID=215587 RepID=A0A6S7ZCW5_9STRA
MGLDIPEEIKDSLKDVRNDSSDTNFVVVGYDENNPNALILLGSGSSGIEGIKATCKADDVCYSLLRVNYTFEKAGVIKSDASRFIFVYLRPESIPLQRKMKIGTAEGQVKKLFTPFMKNFEISSLDELNKDKVDDMIATITQTKNKTTQKKAEAGFLIDGVHVSARSNATDKVNAYRKPDSQAKFTFNQSKGASVSFTDPDKLKEEIANVRDDNNPCRWCLFSYIDKKQIEFTGSGNGDVSEMLGACPDDKVAYGLFRFTEIYDKQEHVKFGFVHWSPANGLSPILKATISTHKGAITPQFRPFHHQFYVENRSELDEERAVDAVASLSGTKSKVTDRKAEKKKSVYQRKMIGGATKETQTLQYVDKEELRVAIANVRNDSMSENWVIAGFIGDKKNVQFGLKGKGSGGAKEMAGAFDEESIQYGLLRTNEKVDGYDTVKFTLIQYQPSAMPLTMKGIVGVYHGAVTSMFTPHHANLNTSDKQDILNKFA